MFIVQYFFYTSDCLLYENEIHFKLVGYFQNGNMKYYFNHQSLPYEILKLIIEDQKNDMLVKEQVELNESAIKRNQEMIETKFRNIYRYLGENCPCFDNLSNEF